MPTTVERPKPFLLPQFCKGCGRCIESCAKHCIEPGTEVHPETGLIPVVFDLENCTACGLCMSACPEPYGLAPQPESTFELEDPATLFGPRPIPPEKPETIPDTRVPLGSARPLVVKGTYASAIGALLAGCRHFFGYPITPSTEGAELMAQLLPRLDGAFVQAVSEVATVNMMYGCGGAGLRAMTFTSSPGFSLMLEGISYMVGAEVPGVFVNVMRGGPGLGNIAPEQADIKLACRGLGHGNTHGIVLTPSTPQEMLDLTMLAFDLSFRYRNPVVVLCDGYLGQMTGKVTLPERMVAPGLPDWAVWGDRAHRRNLIVSIQLSEPDLEKHNEYLERKYAEMTANEQRADLFRCDDADVLVVACNTPARMAKGAVETLRGEGIKAGLFRPLTLWPFPVNQIEDLLPGAKRLVVVEASSGGQLEDELRLSLSKAGLAHPPIEHVRHSGGILPQAAEIVERVTASRAMRREKGVPA
ncbi:MAG: 3-methyl-2-oxobutanoate dehydrogenase subunit VorB [Acidobacteria bacterium]|jgi:pyruvate/2-oxoacid:ferredoxin oxidoreductase alpha subunit/NAD-dependent dihydropyrimidine dehydrogenase PreA subunit|nr:3-methyl-2-oxobutanoate dehydrogenase subunit VorB [Acidobacteriota bacterium]